MNGTNNNRLRYFADMKEQQTGMNLHYAFNFPLTRETSGGPTVVGFQKKQPLIIVDGALVSWLREGRSALHVRQFLTSIHNAFQE